MNEGENEAKEGVDKVNLDFDEDEKDIDEEGDTIDKFDVSYMEKKSKT